MPFLKSQKPYCLLQLNVSDLGGSSVRAVGSVVPLQFLPIHASRGRGEGSGTTVENSLEGQGPGGPGALLPGHRHHQQSGTTGQEEHGEKTLFLANVMDALLQLVWFIFQTGLPPPPRANSWSQQYHIPHRSHSGTINNRSVDQLCRYVHIV